MAAENQFHLVQRRVVVSGVILFTVGLFTGLWSGAALNGMVQLAQPRLALAAHLNALLGGLELIALGYSMSFLKYDVRKLNVLALLLAIPAWANWIITLVASLLGVNGLAYNADTTNNAVAFGLQALVVAPSLLGGIFWVGGFYCGKRRN